VLDSELATRPFIASNSYTIADMSIFAYSHVAADAHLALPARKNLCAWFDCVRRQPGFAGEVVPHSADPYSSEMLPFAV
jgi:glutathione S-transferase